MRPFQKAVDAWMTVPGIKHRLAWALVAKIGPTVEAFPSAADVVSWAGICPGNNESAGKRKSGTTRKGVAQHSCLQPWEPLAAAGSAGRNRRLVADQRAAEAGENGWAIG